MLGMACLAPETTPATKPALGADEDGRGCLVSAGYTYSEMLKRCLRLWEEGVRLQPTAVRKDGSAVFSSFVLLSASGEEAELFLPRGAAPVRMRRAFTPQGPYWTKHPYRLQRLPQGWRLYERDRLIYAAGNPPSEGN